MPEQDDVAEGRRRAIWELFDFAQGTGLEVGPLHTPIVQRGAADVRYLDVFSRERLVASYREDPLVEVELIPEIDFVLHGPDGIRSLAEAAAPSAPYDWVLASHVVEHVPDLVDWLSQLAEVTRDDGALFLAIPDRRYCFDVLRPETTVGEILRAHYAHDEVPSVRAVYDFYRSKVDVDTAALWAGARPPGLAERENSPAEVMDQVRRALEGDYVDAHVWTFTPASFVDQVAELRGLGLHPWRVERVHAPRGLVEFYVVLRRIPRHEDTTGPRDDEPELGTDLPDWLDREARSAATISGLQQRIDELEEVIARRDP